MNHIEMLLSYENAFLRAQKAKTVASALQIIDDWARSQLRDRRKKVTDEKVARVLDMHSEEESIAIIADAVELSQPTVRRILKVRNRA